MGKVCVITGASQGIGRAAAIRMSREPDVDGLVLIARNAAGLEETAAALERGGKRDRAASRTTWATSTASPASSRGIHDALRQHRHPAQHRRATPIRSRCSTRRPTTSSRRTRSTSSRCSCSSARSIRYMVRPAGQDPQRGVDGGDHLAAGLAGLRLVEGGRRVAVGDARRRAGRQRASRSTASRPGRTATELRRKLAPEEDPTKIMQPSHVADVIAPAHARRRADAGRPEHHRPQRA